MRTDRRASAIAARAGLALVFGVAGLGSVSIGSGEAQELFPAPFRLEHRMVVSSGTEGDLQAPSVTDYYGGHWLVSVRPDRGRTVIDLARHEITDINIAKGTFSTVSFDRFAELRRRSTRAEGGGGRPSMQAASASTLDAGPRVRVDELATPARSIAGAAAGVGRAASPPAELGTRRFRVEVAAEQSQAPAGSAPSPLARVSAEISTDGRVTLSAQARAAIDSLEHDVLGAGMSEEMRAFGEGMASVRSKADGAIPVRSVRLMRDDAGATIARVEDLATALEPIERFPAELVGVPDGLRQVPHPLEAIVAVLESESALHRAMGERSVSK